MTDAPDNAPHNPSPETVFALASGRGVAGVAVIRLSGPQAGDALSALSRGRLPEPRRATLISLCDPATGGILDRALCLWFPGPNSFTGENVAEIHAHGGKAVVDALLSALSALPGLCPAEAGEFTRRAFEAGKLDLTQAEGLADLVAAETEAQRRQAQRQMDGALTELYEGWRSNLIRAMAEFEAGIDFSDEGDVPDDLEGPVRESVRTLAQAIDHHLADGHRGERLRDGIHLAIVGPPNAGKSSLLNLLAKREAAIVSETAGTTRDVIEVHLDLGGYPVVVADTAGIRETADKIEAEGVSRAERWASASDLRLVVLDGGTWPEVDARTQALVDADCLVVVNKTDLGVSGLPSTWLGAPVLPVSVKSGHGIETLLARLQTRVEEAWSPGAAPALTRERHRRALVEARGALARFEAVGEVELAAEELRLAARAIGRITGRVDVEDLLDVIFRDFCIGK